MLQALLFIWACSTGIYAWVVYGRTMKYPMGHIVTFVSLCACPFATAFFVWHRMQNRAQPAGAQIGTHAAGASSFAGPPARPSPRPSAGSSARLIPANLIAQLPAVGSDIFGSVPPRYRDVSDYYLPGFQRAGNPNPGSAGWDSFAAQFVDELNAGAAAAGGWASAGAFHVARDFVLPEDWAKPNLRTLMDSALSFLSSVGHDGSMIPPFAAGRWAEIRNGRN